MSRRPGCTFPTWCNCLDCFDALLAVGHSLIVVEHNLQMMKAADYIIDLGPGAADEGGQVVAKGTPEEVCAERGFRDGSVRVGWCPCSDDPPLTLHRTLGCRRSNYAMTCPHDFVKRACG